MSRISIVIPVYNAARYLAQTVDSVLAQTITDWELIIVDDGSKDDSMVIARSYAARDGRIRIVQQENRGVATARNRGFDAADPEARYIIFLDADDIWRRHTLETLVGMLEADVRAVCAHGSIDCFTDEHAPGEDHAGAAESRRFREYFSVRQGIVGRRLVEWRQHSPTTFNVLVVRNAIATPGQVLIRRDALHKVGLFDETLSIAADWDLWLRLSSKGDFAFVDDVVLDYRRHGGNMSSQRQAMDREVTRIRQELIASGDLNDEQRRLARVVYGWSKVGVAKAYRLWSRENLARGHWWAAVKQARHALVEWSSSLWYEYR